MNKLYTEREVALTQYISADGQVYNSPWGASERTREVYVTNFVDAIQAAHKNILSGTSPNGYMNTISWKQAEINNLIYICEQFLKNHKEDLYVKAI